MVKNAKNYLGGQNIELRSVRKSGEQTDNKNYLAETTSLDWRQILRHPSLLLDITEG